MLPPWFLTIPPGGVLDRGGIGELPQQRHTSQMDVDGTPRNDEFGVGLRDVLDDLARASRDLSRGQLDVLLSDGRAQPCAGGCA